MARQLVPRLSCDVPAHSYTFSFARNPDWSQHYAPGPEIREYFERVADEFGITSAFVSTAKLSHSWRTHDGNLKRTMDSLASFPTCSLRPGCCTTRMFQSSMASRSLAEPFSTRPDGTIPFRSMARRLRLSAPVQPRTDHLCARRQCERVALFNAVPSGCCRHQTQSSPIRSAPNFEVTLRHMRSTSATRHHDVSANIVCCHRTQFD